MSNSFYIFSRGADCLPTPVFPKPATSDFGFRDYPPRTPGVPKPAASDFGFRGYPPRTPGNFLYAQKVTKKAPGTPRTPVYPIGRLLGRYPVATEFPDVPRNRCGGYPTSPDGPRAEGCFFFVSGSLGGSNNRRQFDIEIRFAYPFKPVGPYPLTPPVADSSEDRATAEVG